MAMVTLIKYSRLHKRVNKNIKKTEDVKMAFLQMVLPVLKNSMWVLGYLLAIFTFIAFLIPNYTARFGKATAKVSIGIVIGFVLALLICLYTVLVGS